MGSYSYSVKINDDERKMLKEFFHDSLSEMVHFYFSICKSQHDEVLLMALKKQLIELSMRIRFLEHSNTGDTSS